MFRFYDQSLSGSFSRDQERPIKILHLLFKLLQQIGGKFGIPSETVCNPALKNV